MTAASVLECTAVSAAVSTACTTTNSSAGDEPEPVSGGGDLRAEAAYLESLVAAAVAGLPGARDRLLRRIHPFVLRYCRGRLGRQETATSSAEDVAQEICMAVVRALPSYAMNGLSFRAFVYGIAAHKVTDAFRTRGRNRIDPVAEVPDRRVDDDGPERRMLVGELNRRLAELLEMLTPRQREVLVLRVAVGLSAEETAVAVHSTPGAVRVTQHRALLRLRAVVVRRGEGVELLAGLTAPAVPTGSGATAACTSAQPAG